MPLEPLADKWRAFRWNVQRDRRPRHGGDRRRARRAPGAARADGHHRAHREGQGRPRHRGHGARALHDAHRGRSARAPSRRWRTADERLLHRPRRPSRSLGRAGGGRPDASCSSRRTSARCGAFTERFPDRHFDVGISEENLVGVAAGLAHAGKLPFVLAHGAVRQHARLRADPRRLRLQPQQRQVHRAVRRPRGGAVGRDASRHRGHRAAAHDPRHDDALARRSRTRACAPCAPRPRSTDRSTSASASSRRSTATTRRSASARW